MKLLLVTIFLLSNLLVSGNVLNIEKKPEQSKSVFKHNFREDSTSTDNPQDDLVANLEKSDESNVSTTTQYYDVEDSNKISEYGNDNYKENMIGSDEINNDEENVSDSYDEEDEDDGEYDETNDSSEAYDDEEYSGENDENDNNEYESSDVKSEKLNQVIDLLYSIGLELDMVKTSIDNSKQEAQSIIEQSIKNQLEKTDDSVSSKKLKTNFLHEAVDTVIKKNEPNNEYLIRYLTVINKFNKYSLLFASVSISILIFFTLVSIFFNKKKTENCDKVHVYEKI